MSAGITPRDFVQQVFYQQEKVLLDFDPSDDKYKEVLMDGNFILQELQKEEDWLWLRDTRMIGLTEFPSSGHEITRFKFDTTEVYKLSSLFGDCVHLCAYSAPEVDKAGLIINAIRSWVPGDNFIEQNTDLGAKIDVQPNGHTIYSINDETVLSGFLYDLIDIDMFDKIDVPLISAGTHGRNIKDEVSKFSKPNWLSRPLGCYVLDDKLCFNRPFLPFECERAVVIDYQKRIEQFHICDHRCPFDEEHMAIHDEPILKMVPDLNYVVIKTAAAHAMGSPTAQGNIMTLNDTAQKLLSAMRENNAMATTCDTMEWYTPGFIEVV